MTIPRKGEIRLGCLELWIMHVVRLYVLKGKTVGLKRVQQDTVYDYTMAVESSDCCHSPLNATPKPRLGHAECWIDHLWN